MIFDRIGLDLSLDSQEAYAYAIGFLTEKTYKILQTNYEEV